MWSVPTLQKHLLSRTFSVFDYLVHLWTWRNSLLNTVKPYGLVIVFLMFVNLRKHPWRRAFCWLWPSSPAAVGAPGGHHHRAAVAEVGRSSRSCHRDAPGWSLQPPVPHSEQSTLITHPTTVFFYSHIIISHSLVVLRFPGSSSGWWWSWQLSAQTCRRSSAAP